MKTSLGPFTNRLWPLTKKHSLSSLSVAPPQFKPTKQHFELLWEFCVYIFLKLWTHLCCCECYLCWVFMTSLKLFLYCIWFPHQPFFLTGPQFVMHVKLGNLTQIHTLMRKPTLACDKQKNFYRHLNQEQTCDLIQETVFFVCFFWCDFDVKKKLFHFPHTMLSR